MTEYFTETNDCNNVLILFIRAATNVEAVIAEWGAHENVVGFSTMHCAPEDVEPMVSVMRSAYSGFIGAYPVQGVDPDSATLSPEAFVGYVWFFFHRLYD